MDGRRFDAMTRALATGSSRRRVLNGVVGGTLGIVAAAAGRTGVEARRCKRFGQRCHRSEVCCAGKCAPRRFVCECHHNERPCYTGAAGERCCPRNARDFRRCCPNGTDVAPAPPPV